MPAKPVQISIDRELLARIDRDPQTEKQWRSAFMRDAVELYLATKHRRDVKGDSLRLERQHSRL